MTVIEEFDIAAALRILRREIKQWKVPVVTIYSRKNKRPAFQVLISCLLSLRTRDAQTSAASKALFAVADTPETIAALSLKEIEALIRQVGFYRTKSKSIKTACQRLVEEFHSETPSDIETLLTFKGVGRKTANLVVTLGFNKPGICVDTHVHRICRIWGYTNAPTPDKTESALREKLPRRYWIEFNDILVTFGQNLCKPLSPLCSQCKLDNICPKIGVGKRR